MIAPLRPRDIVTDKSVDAIVPVSGMHSGTASGRGFQDN